MVNFRKKADAADNVENTETSEKGKTTGGGNGDQQIRQWLGMVTDEDQNMAQSEKINVDKNLGTADTMSATSSTTPEPSSTASTR